jgi:hypothetical protein
MTKFLRYILKKVKPAGVFLKKAVINITRFLYRSRKTILLVAAVVLLTLLFAFIVVSLFSNSDFSPSGDYDRTLPTTGRITLEGLEIYGGDVKYDLKSGAFYVDWGELTLGASKNASFHIKSNSNVDVKLELNVTGWAPAGIEEYLTISWDYNGTSLSPTQEILVTVNLAVAASGEFIDFLVTNEVTAFGFDITIYASGE